MNLLCGIIINMNDERWMQLVDRIESSFVVNSRGSRATDHGGSEEWIEFESPRGRVKLVRTTSARVIGERALGSRRIGSDTSIEKIVDPDDLVSRLSALQYNPATGAWENIEFSF